MISFTDNLPLRRTTTVWQNFGTDVPLPIVYGNTRLTPISMDAAGVKFFLADHAIEGVDEVTRDSVITIGYIWGIEQDATGSTISTMTLSRALKKDELLAVRLRGKLDKATGSLIGNPADILYDLLVNICGMSYSRGDFAIFRTDCAAEGIDNFAGVLSDSRATIRSTVENIVLSAGAVWSAAMPGFARIYPPASQGNAVASFAATELSNVAPVSRAGRLATRLIFKYGQDWSKNECSGSLLLSCPDAVKRYGEITTEYRAEWCQSARQAFGIATRVLSRRCRPIWEIPFSAGLSAQDRRPGDTVTISHPHIPGGTATDMLLDAEIDYFQGVTTMRIEFSSGSAPVITIDNMSTAWTPISIGNLSLSYAEGILSIYYFDDRNIPIYQARITLDSTLGITDIHGRCQFTTTRGSHKIKIESTGRTNYEDTISV